MPLIAGCMIVSSIFSLYLLYVRVWVRWHSNINFSRCKPEFGRLFQTRRRLHLLKATTSMPNTPMQSQSCAPPVSIWFGLLTGYVTLSAMNEHTRVLKIHRQSVCMDDVLFFTLVSHWR